MWFNRSGEQRREEFLKPTLAEAARVGELRNKVSEPGR